MKENPERKKIRVFICSSKLYLYKVSHLLRINTHVSTPLVFLKFSPEIFTFDSLFDVILQDLENVIKVLQNVVK